MNWAETGWALDPWGLTMGHQAGSGRGWADCAVGWGGAGLRDAGRGGLARASGARPRWRWTGQRGAVLVPGQNEKQGAGSRDLATARQAKAAAPGRIWAKARSWSGRARQQRCLPRTMTTGGAKVVHGINGGPGEEEGERERETR